MNVSCLYGLVVGALAGLLGFYEHIGDWLGYISYLGPQGSQLAVCW